MDHRPEKWEERVALYAAYLVDKGVQSATLKSYITAIKKTLEADDYRWDNEAIMFSSLTRACRMVNDKVKNRLPIQKGLLEMLLIEIHRYFVTQYYLELMYKSMFTLAYFGLLRVGELATGNHAVRAKDIYSSKQKQKLKIYLYTSKTHGRESPPQVIKITGDFITEDDEIAELHFNPYKITDEFLTIRGGYEHDNEPLYIFRDGTPVSTRNFRKLLKILLKSLNLDPSLYDTHSFRIGRATDLKKHGYSIEEIKALGRWKSNSVYKYLKQY